MAGFHAYVMASMLSSSCQGVIPGEKELEELAKNAGKGQRSADRYLACGVLWGSSQERRKQNELWRTEQEGKWRECCMGRDQWQCDPILRFCISMYQFGIIFSEDFLDTDHTDDVFGRFDRANGACWVWIHLAHLKERWLQLENTCTGNHPWSKGLAASPPDPIQGFKSEANPPVMLKSAASISIP